MTPTPTAMQSILHERLPPTRTVTDSSGMRLTVMQIMGQTNAPFITLHGTAPEDRVQINVRLIGNRWKATAWPRRNPATGRDHTPSRACMELASRLCGRIDLMLAPVVVPKAPVKEESADVFALFGGAA